MPGRRRRVVVRAAIERDGRLLCVRHATARGAFWCLPGGRIEAGETAGAAVVRELQEETGATVAADGVVLVQEQAGRLLELVLRCRLLAGEPALQPDAEPVIVAVAWHPIAALPDDLLPHEFVAAVTAAGSMAALPVVPLVAWN